MDAPGPPQDVREKVIVMRNKPIGARKLRRILCSALRLLLLFALPLSAQESAVQIAFLNVGQGDAILITAPEGQQALIDAGPGVLLGPALQRWGVDTLNLVVASHPHSDHIGGMAQVLEAVPVRFYMDNGQPHTTTTYSAVMMALRSRPEITYLEAIPRTLQLGSVVIHVLPLPSNPGSNLNNRSVGLVLEYGEFSTFLSGDSERRELDHFVAAGVVPDVTLLKAPHHGSSDAVSQTFLQASNPEVVVVSVGGNSYGHPAPGALAAYARHAETVLRTDLHGEVVVSGYPDGSYELSVAGQSVARGTGTATRSPVEDPTDPEAQPERGLKPPIVAAKAQSTTGSVEVYVFADAPGNDHNNPNGEYAVLTNVTASNIDLGGWSLCDAARHCFRFPQGAQLPGGAAVHVFTGSGVSDGVRFFMGSGAAVWNNRGDTATLTDPEGRVIATYVY